LYFFSIFLTDAVLGAITIETNRYAKSFLDKAKAENKLKNSSDGQRMEFLSRFEIVYCFVVLFWTCKEG